MKTPDLSRRYFIKLAAYSTALLPLGHVLFADAADSLPHLSVRDQQAKTLGYIENVAKVDPAKEHAYKQGSNCQNCTLYQGAQVRDGYAPCSAFPGKSVSANGWCRVYAAKAS